MTYRVVYLETDAAVVVLGVLIFALA